MKKLNKNQYYTRKESIITGGELEEISNIEDFPVFIGSTEQDISNDFSHNLTFDICKDTGLIQLRDVVNSEFIYPEYHSEAIGKTWQEHHEKLSEIIKKYSSEKTVLEIGGSDSRLATMALVENDSIKKWTIVDPNLKNRVKNDKIIYIEDFFDENSVEEFDLIVHSHTLEHMINPQSFIKSISKKTNVGDYHIFSVPNLYLYLENKYTNTINFEHTIFLTEEIIDYLLNSNYFEVEDKIYYSNHSIFYITKKVPNLVKIEKPNLYDKYKKMYCDLIEYYKNFVIDVNKSIENIQNDIYLFGGHIFSQYLISLGLNTEKIKFILDNSEIKDGKRLYGTNLFIKSPSKINFSDNSIIILKAGQYQNEIKSQLSNLNKNITFYE